VEVSSLTHASTAPGLRGPSPLLRFQPDEKLVALTRRGQHAAFETLCARYQSRLLSFVRHMLGSREDAEDVLQEVFTAAFNAVLADDREINVRPWLYRIARNRSLNHLRRASAVGVDSMDVHFADHGLSTSDRVLRRESFRELLADVQQLPETQRTALLLREIDALSYEQISHAMETTVPSVKSLLVRARISLAEAAEARKLSCSEVRLELGEVAEGLITLSAPARRHVRDCDRCRAFKRQLKDNNRALAMLLPVGPLLLVKKLLLAKLGSAGSAHVASGAGATMGAGAAAGAGAAGGAGAGGVFTLGAGALATKAVAGLAAAAIVSAGAVAANQGARPHHHHAAAVKATYVPAERESYLPLLASQRAQPVSVSAERPAAIASRHARRRALLAAKRAALLAKAPVATAPAAAPSAPTTAAALPAGAPAPPPAPAPALTQLTSESTQLPAAATATTPAAAATAAAGSAPATPAPQPPVAASGPAATQTPAAAGSGSAPSALTGAGSEPAPAIHAAKRAGAKTLAPRRRSSAKAHTRHAPSRSKGAPHKRRHGHSAAAARRS
jgi:RNA polymerase sigma factor (sigma-70 family)